jgi:hypothetical protein
VRCAGYKAFDPLLTQFLMQTILSTFLLLVRAHAYGVRARFFFLK